MSLPLCPCKGPLSCFGGSTTCICRWKLAKAKEPSWFTQLRWKYGITNSPQHRAETVAGVVVFAIIFVLFWSCIPGVGK